MADATTHPAIRAVDIRKSFGRTAAVDRASVEGGPGEIVALLGPSGSGKTTLLRVVAGFEVPDAGTVEIGGRPVAGPGVWEEPDRRRIGMVFQDGALFPHLTVARNVAFGEPAPGRVEECLALVGLADRAGAYPHELSGGERQRVALARALATDPEVVLLDEPFAALDAGLRESLREDVAGILRAAGASALLVTHDQQEALSLADRVVVLRDGRVEQDGTPEEVYDHPTSRWAAEFLGAADVLPGTADGETIDCELGHLPADRALRGDVEVVVRPEHLAISPAHAPTGDGEDAGLADGRAPAPDGAVKARVVGRSYYGHDQLVRLELASGVRLRSRSTGTAPWCAGDEVLVWVAGPVSVLTTTPAEVDAVPAAT
jgi:iron(III) transport system ATP-binding protein